MNQEVMTALGNWILRITDEKRIATPEEVAALPEVAKVFFLYYPLATSQAQIESAAEEATRKELEGNIRKLTDLIFRKMNDLPDSKKESSVRKAPHEKTDQ